MRGDAGNSETRSFWARMVAWVCAVGLATSAHAQTVEYIHTDALGSPVAVTDANGNVIERTEYSPYGDVLNRPDADGPGFTGHVLDAATGMNYMQQRYYDPGIGRFLSVDPIAAHDSSDVRFFNRYYYAFGNLYRFSDIDGRCPICIPAIFFFLVAMTHSEPANAPGPGDKTYDRSSFADAASDAIPGGGKVIGGAKETMHMAAKASDKLSQRAASREARRQAGIPTSQQPSGQTNGRAPDGTPVGRQQSYEVPTAGGGTETKSVQVSRDTRGDHAGIPQIEAGTVKPGGQSDVAGRPRLQNEDKVRVDFEPRP